MQALGNFFIFCSGVTPSLLKRTPSDYNKYAGIGATIFFTGCLAAIAAGFALYTIFQSYWIAIPFALVWGMMIFNLDRFIVSSMKDRGKKLENFAAAIPRLVLAVLIALVISKPLELKIFSSEIASELVTMEQEKYKVQEDLFQSRFAPEKESLAMQLATKDSILFESESEVNALRAEAIAEADGTGGSQIRNMGPIYKIKQEAYEKAYANHNTLVVQINGEKELIAAKLTELENREKEALSELKLIPLNGFAAQLNALGRLSKNNRTIAFASLFITLLFICLESLPIFTKLISTRSPYDLELHKLEHKYEMGHKSVTTKSELETLNELDYLNKTKSFQSDQMASAENEIFKHGLAKKIEEEKQKTRTWKEILTGPRLSHD